MYQEDKTMLQLNAVELNRKCGFLFEEDLDLHKDSPHTWHYRSVHDPTLFDVLTLADGISPP